MSIFTPGFLVKSVDPPEGKRLVPPKLIFFDHCKIKSQKRTRKNPCTKIQNNQHFSFSSVFVLLSSVSFSSTLSTVALSWGFSSV